MSDLTQNDVVETMRGERFVMMTSVSPSGKLESHPMVPQQVTDDADVWFFIGLQGEQAQQLRQNPSANLAFAEAGSWLSVAGTVEFVDDRSKIDELWSDSVEAWFDGGKNDPNLGLIRFNGESAQFWGSRGGKLAMLSSIAKSKITGERPSGTSGTVEL